MTPDINWSNIEIDTLNPNFLFDVSDDEELKETFNWKNTKCLLKQVHHQKYRKFNLFDCYNIDCRLQFLKPYHFLKTNEEW